MRFIQYTFSLILVFLCLNAFSQNNRDTTVQKSDTTKEFHEVTKMAEFPGGQTKLYAYISKKIQYPPGALENDIEGKIIVQFVVRPDGSITDVETLGKPIGWGLEEEAMRVIKNMPKWEPAEMKGTKVSVRFRLPISFQIPEDQKKKKQKPKKKSKIINNPYD